MIDQVSSTDGWNLILSRLLVCYHSSIQGADSGNYTKHCYRLAAIILQMSPVVSTPLASYPCQNLLWLACAVVTEVLIKNQRQGSVKHNLIGLTESFCKEIKNNGKETQKHRGVSCWPV